MLCFYVSLPHFLGKIRTVQLICQLTTLIVLGAVTRLTEVPEYWNTHKKYRNTLDFITTDIYISNKKKYKGENA